MDHAGIFSATLGLSQCWQIDRISFDEPGRVNLYLSCRPAHSLRCPVCGGEGRPGATQEELWHHPDFLGYAAYLHADVPLVECRTGCGIAAITVPWARPGSRFILLGRKSPSPRTEHYSQFS